MQEALTPTRVARVRTTISSRLKSCKGDPVRWGNWMDNGLVLGGNAGRGQLALVVSRSTRVTTKLESPFMTANGISPFCQPSHIIPDMRIFSKRIGICSRLCPRSKSRACAGIVWQGLGHTSWVRHRSSKESLFDVLVLGLDLRSREPLDFKRRGAQDGTCLACVL
jgi:hypothetical protein